MDISSEKTVVILYQTSMLIFMLQGVHVSQL